MDSKYITVLDFEVGKVFQYKVKERFEPSDEDYYEIIIIEKAETESNLSSIARDYNIPRRTLRDWVKNQVA